MFCIDFIEESRVNLLLSTVYKKRVKKSDSLFSHS